MVGYLKPNMVIRVLMSLLYFNNSYCICHSLKTQRATHAISYASNIVPQCLSLGIPGERRSHLGPQMYVCVRKAKISIVLYSPCRNSTCVRAGIDPLHSAARQKQRSLHHTNVTLYPPPRVPGFALFKSPRSNPPFPEGRLDFLKGPRSNPPLPEGRLDIRKSPRSNPPYRFQETLQKRSE